jgi:hypothetical protein
MIKQAGLVLLNDIFSYSASCMIISHGAHKALRDNFIYNKPPCPLCALCEISFTHAFILFKITVMPGGSYLPALRYEKSQSPGFITYH